MNYILDGQHQFAAASALREELVKKEMPLPKWMTTFRCKRINPDTKLDRRQLIAGRQQARTTTVMQQSLSQKVMWFLREVKESDPAALPSKAALLQKVYLKCGCTRTSDGSLVCSPFFWMRPAPTRESLLLEWVTQSRGGMGQFVMWPVCECCILLLTGHVPEGHAPTV